MADQINLSRPPYNDRFNPEQSRNMVLFNPDRPLQQAELNELQSILNYNLQELGNSVFEDGAMQSGMAFRINKEEDTLVVEDGLIYLDGKVRQFREQSIEFTGEGTEKIGVKIVQKVVDYNEDPTLLDQTQGVDSYLSAGADRLQELVVLTINDDDYPTIYEFIDGELFIEPDRPEFSLINNVLAQRTYEESGSYQVQGFKMYTEPSEEEGKVTLVIDGGTAYVLGYRISKPTATRIPLDKSQEFKEVVRETHTYDTSVRKFKVGSTSVKEINRVIARTESPAGGINLAKGAEDGRDAIPSEYTSIDRNTTTLWTTSPERVYEYGKDYTIVEESGIQYVNWDTGINGAEPASGTSYFLSFEYDRLMKEGVDYKVEVEDIGEGIPGWYTYIDFNGMTGIKPKNEGIISVNYEFYLAREDIVTLDKLGRFVVIPGQPDRDNSAEPPEHEDPNTLKIGNVFVYPNSDYATAENTGVFRLRMRDLQKIKARLEDVEYNQVIQELETQAVSQDDPLSLRGVFADAFVDFSRMDMNLSTIALSTDDASITLQTNAPDEQKRSPIFSENESVASSWGRLVTAPYTENKEINQPLATEAMNVNPYAVYNKLGVLTLTPDSDNWIEEEKITINETEYETVRMDRWWAHNRPTSIHKDLRDMIDRIELDEGQEWAGQTWSHDVRNGRSGTITDVSTKTREEAIEYIRQRDVEFKATNLKPMANNLYLTFDGTRVPITPTGSTVAGAETGTIMANSRGEATGKFHIPAGIRTGTREVTLQSDDNIATTTYTAQGTFKTTEEVITKTRVTINLYDPLAQSFVFPQERVVTSFDVYFASKSETDNIIFQVRGMSEGGFPNTTIHAERIMTPDEISTSEDASAVTKVALDDPLMCNAGQSYCLVIITDSNEYTMWLSTLGQPRIDSPSETVNSQPYVNGVLFSSSNARTWTVHQKSDLKFSVYTARFEEEGIIEFEPMEDLDADMILLMATYLTPSNTGCKWDIKVIPQQDVDVLSLNDVPWQPLSNYVEQVTSPTIIGLAKLRATFKSNRYISPMMTLEDLLFVNFISETSGDYVTLNINSEESPFNTITMGYDAFIPLGTSVTPYYSLDGGQTWKEFDTDPTVSRRSAEFNRYVFSKRLSDEPRETQIKFKLSLEAENRFVRPRVRLFTGVFKDEI